MAYRIIEVFGVEPVLLAEARLQCRIDDDDTSEDSLLEAWIASCREVAEHYTGHALVQQTLEMAMDRFPGCTNDWRVPGYIRDWRIMPGLIELDMPPVASVTSIKYTDISGVEQTIDSSAYMLSPYGLARKVTPTAGNSWPATQDIPDAVRILYTTGDVNCPQAAKAAILLMVAWLNENRGDTIQPDDIQPPAAKSLLNTIKVWGF